MNRPYEYYRDLGFFRARISRELICDQEQNSLTIRFVIDEGPGYKVRKISFDNVKSGTARDLAKSLKLKQGDFYDKAQLGEDIETIKENRRLSGFAFADVEPELRFVPDLDEFDIIYRMVEAKPVG
ncbi:MAG: hypothetical protein B7Z73_13760 [Planctomycetia bacterium 21-64-5]|nr:MAG: hypothetical protein B7Z73_13760 [Planctomycetia bacterium 21-64-5]HQU46957.1 POTRA domain-containing protein [Pirellulales bacterium]